MHEAKSWLIDRYSSAIGFRGWAELPPDQAWTIPRDYEPLIVGAAASWLLRIGWRERGGGLIPLRATPGPWMS